MRVVPTPGVEPGRPFGQRILSPRRLPVPPRGLADFSNLYPPKFPATVDGVACFFILTHNLPACPCVAQAVSIVPLTNPTVPFAYVKCTGQSLG